MLLFIVLCSALFCISPGSASEGDRSPVFQKCVGKCTIENCTEDNSTYKYASLQPAYHIHLLWPCKEECKYWCMWQAVDFFEERGWGVPQFHGKWPFVRIFGVQEPASVLFSLFNLVAHLNVLQKYRSKVPKFSPTYSLWKYHSMICINAWLWSSIFHTRDYPWTEMMDYFCAFSMVLFSFYAMVMRLLHCKMNLISITFSVICASFFIYHITYLSIIHFDYAYNMKANIAIGILNGSCWLLWCTWKWLRHGETYVWRCAFSVVLALLTMSLEVLDFPPLYWTLDAHSLWHLSTTILPFIWNR
ncbi:hypothetical protein B566_EDAN008381 [Ephemera danica]|nr:hypothetical protein B566_EDAN008381 [Ephemera danica]